VNKELKAGIEETVETTFDEIVAFAQRLIRFRSVNPVFLKSESEGEKEMQLFLGNYLSSLGFEAPDIWEPDPEDLRRKYLGKPGYVPNRTFKNRPDLVARLPGSGGGRSLMLAGHIDVVGADPTSETWTFDPFSATLHEGKIYGRGAVDMKGGIAAMIQAVRVLTVMGIKLRGDVLVGTVVDEETGGMGTLSLLDRGYKADAAIITEPTNLRVATQCRGIIWGHIYIKGRAGHIEITQPPWNQGGAVDAIALGRRVLTLLDKLNREWAGRPEKSHPLLPRPCEISVSMLQAGQHPSSFAENCRITVDVQYLAHERDENGLGGMVKREIEDYVRHALHDDPWLRRNPPRFEWFVDVDPAELDPKHEIVVTLQEALGRMGLSRELFGFEAHSDSSLFNNHGIPTVDFGPGDPFLAHQPDEYLTLDHLKKATIAIAITLADWCGID